MKLPSTSIRNFSRTERGFTLIEIMVAAAVMGLIMGVGTWMSFSALADSSFNAETDLIVALLQKARARSMSNMFQSAHGLYFDTSRYVLFRGTTYNPADPSNEAYPQNTSVSRSGPPAGTVVFQQLSGMVDAAQAGTIALSQDTRSATITINTQGSIDW